MTRERRLPYIRFAQRESVLRAGRWKTDLLSEVGRASAAAPCSVEQQTYKRKLCSVQISHTHFRVEFPDLSFVIVSAMKS